MANILLIDDDATVCRSLGRRLRASGHQVAVAAEDTDALAAARISHPDAVVLDMDLAGNRGLDILRTLKRRERTRDIPVLTLSSARGLAAAEEFFQAGASEFLGKPYAVEKLERKLALMLRAGDAPSRNAGVPADLRDAFEALKETSVPLGDVAEVFHGIAPRHRRFRRCAPLNGLWKGVLSAAEIGRFRVDKPECFLRFDRNGLLRVPAAEEYDQPEKVVVARTAPPVIAAVDRGGHPVANDLYAVVPAKGLGCAYLACLFNSRLLDFFLHRVRPLANSPAGAYLRSVDLQALPVVVPAAKVQARFMLYAKALGGIEQRPDREGRVLRVRLLKEMNQLLLDVYGFPKNAARLLAQMHF